MANQDIRMRVKYSAEFDTSKVSEGLKDIRKQLSSSHIGEDLRKQLEQALNKVEVNIPALEKMSAKGEYNSKELETFQKLVQQVSKDMQALDKLAGEADFTKSFSAADTEKIKQFEKQLDEVENKLKTTRKEIIDAFSKSENGKINGKSNATLNNFIEQLISVPPDQIEDKLNEVVKEVESQAENTVQKLKEDFKTKADKNKIHKEDFINLIFGQDSGVTFKQGKTLDDNKDKTKIGARTVYNQIREDILALKEDASASDVEKILEKYSNFVNEYFNVPEGKQSILANIVTPEIVEAIKQFAGPEGLEKLKTLIGEENLKILADGEAEKLKITQEQAAFLKERLDGLVQSKKLTADQAKAVMNALGGMNDKIQEGSEQIKKEKAQADALNATFGGLIHRIGSTVSAMTVFNKGMQITRNAIQSVKELDAAFTQIAIVSEQSGEQAWKLFNDFNKLAKQYSITTKDLTEGAKLFYQQGLSAADTMKMVEASTVSAALGEVTMTEAANTLTAAIQGYNESAAVAMDYTDKIAKVGAVSAADFNELSAAMEKTASSAYTAGIDFDHLLGYLGKMIEVTREAPANLGTAMKTIIARFEDMKKDPNALIDGASANKVEAALATIGIALRDAAGEFRPLQEVFDELGMKWQDLTRNQQAYIATVAAGSRQQSRFLAMMNNYDRTLELITESQNSAGAAAEQYAIYQDSIAAAQARLTASWEKLYSKIVDNDIIKFAINGLTELIELLSHIPPSITAIGASIGALQLQQWFRGGDAKNLLEKIFGKFMTDKETGEIKKIGENIAEKFIDSFKDKSIKEIRNQTNILKMLTDSNNKGTESTNKLSNSIKGLGSNLKTTGKAIWGIISGNWQIIAIAAALTGIIYLINSAAQRVNNLAKEINKLRTEANKKFETASNLEKLLDTYDELTSKIVLTEEEQNTLNETIKEIGSSYDGAITYVNEYGDMVLANTETVKKHTQALKDEAYEMEKNAIRLQKEFLGSDRGKWTKENFQNAGFGEYWEQYNSTGGKLGGISSNFLDLTENNEATIAGIKEGFFGDEIYNEFIKLQKSTGIIADDGETIAEYWARVKEEVGDVVDGYSNVLDLMNKSVEIQELELEINHDNTLTTEQSIVAHKMLGKLSDSSVESWNALKDSLQKSGITLKDFITTISKSKNPEELFKNIEEYLNGEIDSGQLQTSFNNAGIKNGDKFVEGFIAEFEAKEAELDKTIQEWAEKNGITVNIDGLTYSEKKLYSELAPLFAEGGELYEPKKLPTSISDFDDLTEEQQNILLSSGRTLSDFDKAFNEGDNAQKLQKYLDRIESAVKDKNAETLNEITSDAEKELNGPLMDVINLFAEEGKENIIWQFSNVDDNIISSYQNALDIFKKGNEEPLTDKEIEFIGTTNMDLTPYMEINEQGEKYLSIMGKILLLQKTSSDYEEEILRARSANVEAINNIEKELDKIPDKEEEITESHQIQIKQYSEDLAKHSQMIKLLDKRSAKLKEVQKAEEKAMVLSNNIAKAKEAYDNAKAIGEAYKEASENQGQLSLATAQDLINMNAFNAEYLKVVEGRIMLTREGAEEMKKIQQKEYEEWLKQETAKLDYQIGLYSVLRDAALKMADSETEITGQAAFDQLSIVQQQYETEHKDQKEALEKGGAQQEEALKQYALNWATVLQVIQDNANKVYENIASGVPQEINVQSLVEEGIKNLKPVTVDNPINFTPLNPEDLIDINDSDKVKEKLRELAEGYQERIDSLEKLKELLPSLGESIEEGFNEALEGATSGSKEAAKALEAMAKAAEDLLDALEDLDELLKNIQKDLDDISVDYNPFTDLFEAWEHEWDYYYNIKRLISQIQTQGQFIDNIISSDYASAEQKSEARKAQVGNLLAQMSANDAYITALRAGMAQTGVELMENYGEYYKIDPETGQIYQTDKNLSEINDTINERRQEIYDLQKLQNEKENDLTLENAKLDALEEEKSAYEEILSTIDSQLESLKENEDVTVDTTELENQKAEIEAKIEVSEDSIEETKDKIEELEDEIQEIEVDITLKDQEASQLEDYVSDMEDKVSEYEEYWENLNATIEEQQQLLQKLAEARDYYIETAIATEQELYDAIVENYQKEIDEKKKQYDYLKKLDSDYLNSIKENINKEKQMREDANKQKSYQQNVQRAQLLQMDTSGAFRNELASLNKEIEKQREEFYDDLIQKQYDALENEIEKRHELYDKEVAALEERLAYMQENAFLLWESVNAIVASGTDAMMATLENTTNYINSNELARQQQRTTWEDNILTTFEGTQEGLIASLVGVTDAGNELVSSYPEVEKAIDDYKLVFDDAKSAIDDYTNGIKSGTSTMVDIFDDFMTKWNDATNKFTGYADSWSEVIKALELQTEDSKNKLKDYYDDEGNAISELVGSIGDYDEQIKEVSKDMYDDFISERERYRDELQDVIDTIQSEITAAIEGAAQAIQEAADNIEFTNPTPSYGGDGDGGGSNTPTNPEPNPGGGQSSQKYKIVVRLSGQDTDGEKVGINKTLEGYSSPEEAIEAAKAFIEEFVKSEKLMAYGYQPLIPIAYAKGGLANFTGPAWLDGTKSAPERILSPRQTQLFESMVSSLEKASNNSNINSALGSSYKIGDINTNINVEKLDNETDIDTVARQVENRIMKSIRNRVSLAIA